MHRIHGADGRGGDLDGGLTALTRRGLLSQPS